MEKTKLGKRGAYDISDASDLLGVNALSDTQTGDEVSEDVKKLIEEFFYFNHITNDEDKANFLLKISADILDKSKKTKIDSVKKNELEEAQTILEEAQAKIDENIQANRAKLAALVDESFEMITRLNSDDVEAIIASVKSQAEAAYPERPQKLTLGDIIYTMSLHKYLKEGVYRDIQDAISLKAEQIGRNKFPLMVILATLLSRSYGSTAGIGILLASVLQITETELNQIGESWSEPQLLSTFLVENLSNACSVGYYAAATAATGMTNLILTSSQIASAVVLMGVKGAMVTPVKKLMAYFQNISNAYEAYRNELCADSDSDSVSSIASSAASTLSTNMGIAFDNASFTSKDINDLALFFGESGSDVGASLNVPVQAAEMIAGPASPKRTPDNTLDIDFGGRRRRKSRRHKKRRSTLKRRRMKRRRTRKGKKRRHTKKR
jgi:hypothetical protein